MQIYFGKNIRLLRQNKNLNQTQLGDMFEVKNTTVGGWENGKSFPEFRVLVEMREYFGVDLERLIFSDLSAITMPTAEEPTGKYEKVPDNLEVERLRSELERVTEQLERLRGEVGKMGVMDARLQLLERQLELVLGELGRKKG